MAKSTSGGEGEWRQLLAAAVVEFRTRKVVGPYALKIPRRAFHHVTDEGTLSVTDLANGDRLLTYMPPRPAAKPKR
jgi:hypothetical protein